MKILISNDDGYSAPGLTALADALSEIAEIAVVAPDRNRSGASSSLTLTHPVLVAQRSPGVYAVEGTPADCVNIALGGLIPFQPDLVVSGINDGPNMADDTLYSGTIAAAIEGRFLGVPSLAVSMGTFHARHFDDAARTVVTLVQSIALARLPEDTILNINIPDLPLSEIQGWEATRLGTRLPPNYAAVDASPRGQPLYWLGPAGDPDDNSSGTDFHALANNRVSITPLKVDMTRHESLAQVQRWLDEEVAK